MTFRLEAADGHEFDVYRLPARPEARKGAIVVLQEVFGVNEHIRKVCQAYADEGYETFAPSLFDRVQPNMELGYEGEDLGRGRELKSKVDWDTALLDISTCVEEAHRAGLVGVVGYCWGGSLAWLCASRLPIDAAACYYGGQVSDFLGELPRCPVQLHFGDKDPHIPKANVDAVAAAFPELPLYRYDAGHGFNCDARTDYHAESATLSKARSLAFFAEHLG